MDTSPRSLGLGPLRDAERVAAVGVLARAFRDNPLNVAVIGANARRRVHCNAHGMRALLPMAQKHGCVLAARAESGALLGALVATPPRAYPLPAPPLGRRLLCLLGQGVRVARHWECVFHALERLHPLEPHWYLGTLGIDPPHQGRGVGAVLLGDWLGRVDRDGAPAYLETDARANVSFYERQGFAVEEQLELLGVPVWRMQRQGCNGSR